MANVACNRCHKTYDNNIGDKGSKVYIRFMTVSEYWCDNNKPALKDVIKLCPICRIDFKKFMEG